MNLKQFQLKVHQQNKEMGWHDKPRTHAKMRCLIRSELGEAMEGDRKGLMDDHLPHIDMKKVELADFVIRIMDYTALNNQFLPDEFAHLIPVVGDFCEDVDILYSYVDRCRYEQPDLYPLILATRYVFSMFDHYGYGDLMAIMQEKLEYNRTRADHQKENRNKPGGKDY